MLIDFYTTKVIAIQGVDCRSIDIHQLLQLFNIKETYFLPVIGQDAFRLQLIDHGRHRLAAAADEAGDIFMREEIGHAKAFGRVLAEVLLHELPEEMDEPGLYVLIEQVDQPVLDIPQFGADLFAVAEGQVGPVLQQFFKVIDGKCAEADIILVGPGKFAVKIVPFQAELPEELAFLNDLLDLFIAIIIDIADLDGALLEKIYLVMIVGLEIDILSFRYFYHMMLDFEILIFFIGEVTPEVVIFDQQHVLTRHSI